MFRQVWILVLLVALMALPAQRATAQGGGDKPIVAVFAIEAKRVDLDLELIEALTDLLANGLTATDSFQVVPRAEMKKRLLSAKRESYKNCYDQNCQIELGRELAADKTLHSQIIKIGEKCNVSATLYDLKKASSEKAAKATGGCSEEEIARSLNAVVDELAGEKKAHPVKSLTAAPPPPKKRTVTDKDRSLQTEWVDLLPVVGWDPENGLLFGADLYLATLKWDNIGWTILELGIWSGDSVSTVFRGGSRAFVPINFDPAGKQSLRLGLGLDFIFWDDFYEKADGQSAGDFGGLWVTPGVGYHYRFDSGFRLGLQLSASIYLVGDKQSERDYWPVAIMLAIPVSWQASL